MSSRAEVLAAAQEMHRLGLVIGTGGNVSGREGDVVHITPAAMEYADMTETDLVSLAPDGEVVRGARTPSSEWRVHLAVYAARPAVGAIVHTHSVQATAWSCLDEPLDTAIKEFRQAAGGEVWTAEDAPAGTDQIARFAVEALENRNAALLYRHGVLALGGSPARALVMAQVVERHAEIAWLLRRQG